MPALRLCVCGLGKVGRPILNMLRLKGFKAIGYDCIPKITEVILEDAVDQSDAVIIMVPTPSLPNGAFANEAIITALRRFKGSIAMRDKPDYLYIVSSTTVPGSCEEFTNIVGPNLVYKPEFIRLAHVDADLLNPPFVLIGEKCKSAGDKVEALHRHISNAPVHRMSLTEAELAKITLNCALTMKISLANQLHLVASRMGCDSTKIMAAVGSDPRIGPGHLKPGWPYGGPCLPRDNRMFQFVASRVGVQAVLSQAADFINEDISENQKALRPEARFQER
jgi:UDPglucose 6-dehydrogenase